VNGLVQIKSERKKESRMKFAITSEQRQYFHKQQMLELEGLLTLQQLEFLTEAIEAEVLRKKNIGSVKYANLPAKELFMGGHDLWRNEASIAKVVTDLKYAEIIAELTHTRLLRLGYDQWFPSNLLIMDKSQSPPTAPLPKSRTAEKSPYDQLLSKTASLRNVCCLQGVCCGLMLCLSGSVSSKDEAYEGVFSDVAGNGVFIAPERAIDFPTLLQRPEQQFLLIVYTEKTALYTMQKDDPHVHELKRLGYVFGDRLNDRLHPIIYR
jgi:hypothetical protein